MPNPYSYQSNPQQNGYFQQDTPMGAFAGANQQIAQNANPVRQQYGQAYGAINPYIGQQTQGIGGQQSVMPYAQAGMSAANKANPYLGGQTERSASVGTNAYAGSNPYLTQAIDSASADARRNFDLSVKPALDSAARASGSFGNSAIQELQQNAYSDLGRNLGNISSGMRMQDYTQQQGLAENALNRNQQNNQFNSGLSAADLGRNMSGFYQGQGLGLQGAGLGLQGAQFDASLGNNINQFNAGMSQADLARNANLAQNMGQFNAGQQSGMSQFNAGQGNALGQYNAGLQQSGNQFNASQGNALNQFNAGSANTMLGQMRNLNQNQNQFDATLGNNRYQFDQNLGWNKDQYNQNMDFATWQANNANMRQGTQDQLAFLNTLMGLQSQGVNAATQQQNTPLNYWQQLLGGAAQAGGLGGTNTQNNQGNPYLGAIGGWQLGNTLRGG